MATAPQPKLTEEQINIIIDGVRTGWLEDIRVRYETEEDPFIRVTLEGQRFNAYRKEWEEIRIILGEFRYKPTSAPGTFKRVQRKYWPLYQEARQVQRVAIHAELSLHPRKKVA